ncbi:MAG: hypothetical protein B7Y26_06430 [Hydrogenophilales bacterium 16-64-46]|nr:MAG: hypothetical protein B7Z32_00190 [Hydrogenophilales bacterium 12-64-13]OYZ05953.1 MAG: hypothetical protein B7Y26_06430 [Hydrogenophilales bacterium 16-64-46]OZA39889.1 MAG: hypothetical protein B7X87_02455 [Hydrogenophilales bacterium 17-64-34]HQT00313.1 hypothetical protein [Thiobacillus sp.]
MDLTMQLSRTMKGQDEIFNLGHTLRPKLRQILFSVGNGISVGELRSKLPNCAELDAMLTELMQGGFVQALRNMATPAAPASASAAEVDVAPAQTYVLEFMAALVGTKSPAYRKMSEVNDLAGFRETLPLCHKVIAAVASPHQAAEMEAAVAQRLG